MVSRRELLGVGAAVAGAMALDPDRADASQRDRTGAGWASSYSGRVRGRPPAARRPGRPGQEYRPTVTPGGSTLPFRVVDGVKVFHLVASEVEHEFLPGLRSLCWGYNGQTHGPTIEAVEGDHVRIYVTNHLDAETTVHWHGVFLPSGMDGVGGLNQRPIHPGETYRYEFTLRQHGTFMYHAHHDEMTQMAMGLMGMFVVHPRRPSAGFRVDRDFAIMLSEWAIEVGTARPNPNAMEGFNLLTMNAKAFPGTAPLVVQTGDRVRIRFGNLSAMDHHPIHLHGHYFKVVATDGGDIPPSGQWPETTVLVPTGSTRTIEFVASEPGDWVMHCHMTHHVMNQMGHDFPNMIGADTRGMDQRVQSILPEYMTMGEAGMAGMNVPRADGTIASMDMPQNSVPMRSGLGPFGEITMGGMFTILKVRDRLSGDGDPGWYREKPDQQARRASAGELARDGVRVPPRPRRRRNGDEL